LSWNAVNAVVLSHTHSDHWKHKALAHLARRRLPLYCHAEHRHMLRGFSSAFRALDNARLIHEYAPLTSFSFAPGFTCKPFAVSHDSGATFGFRFETAAAGEALAYIADLGCWTAELIPHLADADILALEFNHDADMELASGRSSELIARVMGDYGHLSNDQAAGLLREVLRRSERGRLQHLVQLHLSRECNRPSLAAAAAQRVLDEMRQTVVIHAAQQNAPGPRLCLMPRARPAARQALRTAAVEGPIAFVQPLLFPGWEAG
jgi:phosphoribosyl 1,2-cyclic phosphodiesterase